MAASSKWTAALLAAIGGLSVSGLAGYLVGEFAVSGIDPTLAAVYHAAPPIDSRPEYAEVGDEPARGGAYVIQARYASLASPPAGPDFAARE